MKMPVPIHQRGGLLRLEKFEVPRGYRFVYIMLIRDVPQSVLANPQLR